MHVASAPDGSAYVADTAEIRRVRELPWRDWATYENVPELQDRLTHWLQHTPQKCDPVCFSCRHVERLNAPQSVYLAELFALKRAIVPFRTGAGKTLAALLSATVLEKAIGRPLTVLLVVPAAGREKTMHEARAYSRHWRCAAFQLITYEFLANPKNASWLDGQVFDVVLADEAHRLTPRSKAWSRIGRYLLARAKAGTPSMFVPFTASLSSRKLEECWHYSRVAMGDAGPFPASWSEMKVWSAATDEKVPDDQRLLPGALGTLAPQPEGEVNPRRRAQRQLGARIAATPGIVSTKEDIPANTLLLRSTSLVLPESIQAIVAQLRDKWVLPNGVTFSSAMDVWRHSRSFGCGLYYFYDPAPPPEWLVRRREWSAFARDYQKYHKAVDSNVLVANLIDRGEVDDGGVLVRWREIEPTFVPVSKHEWVHDTVVDYAVKWLREHERGLCWVEHAPLGARLSELTGFPYFSEGAKDQRTGTSLVGYEGTPAILAMAHSEQFNLQWFSDNLITSVPPTGKRVDQLVGRTLREGQQSDEVTCEFLLTTDETWSSLEACFADAKRAQRVDGQPKKLLYGTCDEILQTMRDSV